jgi:hypothetical protein
MMAEDEDVPEKVLLYRIARDMQTTKQMLAKVINYMVEAETEVSEKMRRFMMYMHDVHDVSVMYETRGIPIPEWIRREMERCDDRYRQLLNEANGAGGTFDKVRREMSKQDGNRWDHTKLIATGGHNEAGKSKQ